MDTTVLKSKHVECLHRKIVGEIEGQEGVQDGEFGRMGTESSSIMGGCTDELIMNERGVYAHGRSKFEQEAERRRKKGGGWDLLQQRSKVHLEE